MKTLTTLLAFTLVASFAVNAKLSVGGSNSKSTLKGDIDRNGEQMQITTFYAESKGELDALVKRVKNYDLDPRQSGVTFYSKQDNVCQIFVIRPKSYSVHELARLGDELYHCTNGNYH